MERRVMGMEKDLKDIHDAVNRMAVDGNLSRNSNNININAGGVGVWVCVSLCGMMLVGMMMGAFWMSREFNRYDTDLSERKAESDRAQTYLSSIYGRMPQWMREEVEKEASAKLKEKEKSHAE